MTEEINVSQLGRAGVGICEGIIKRQKVEIERLEQENEKLKEENEKYKMTGSELLAEKNALQIGYDEVREVREQYKQVLQEIKGIVTDAESKLHCVCDITDMLVNIEVKINEVLYNET